MKSPSLAFLLVHAPLLAQNSDFSMLLSYSGNVVRVGTIQTEEHQVNVFFNYAYQLRENGPHRLYLEFPVAPVGDSNTQVGPAVVVTNGSRFFFTPGVRYQYGISPRVSVYVAGGLGVASYKSRTTSVGVGGVRISSVGATTGGWDAGAGLDFRWTRLVSLRAEFRDFGRMTGPSGKNTPVFAAGVALHF